MSETLEQIARDLHKQLPMATQEDAIEFARRLVAALGAQEPVAWMLRTGHGDKLEFVKPKCEIDHWKPLYAAPVVPADWQMVPKEPTPEMVSAGRNSDEWKYFSGVYKAMLAAAPEYKP